MLQQRLFPYQPGWLFSLLFAMVLLAACQINLPATPAPKENTNTPIAAKPMQPLPVEQAKAPQTLTLPALGLEMPIVPMSWTVTESNGQRTTKWNVPAEALGWHVNSSGAGGAGRIIISGHQSAGAALLAPLARGEVVVGQEVLLTDNEGLVFVYRIAEVSEPIVLAGATPEEQAKVDTYVAATDQPLLTLISGWPDFTTTHRVFAVAELVGMQ